VSPGAEAPGPFELDELTVADLQKRMQSGQDTAKSLVQKYLARIERLDTHDPALHYMIEINPEALTIAEALDEERRKTGPRGALHGVPVLIKDNIGTADRMTTTAGSLALEGSIPAKDSFVAARLREAGAVILGKTNLSEWANFRSTRSSSGWSARGGQAKNPYALDRNPSGSSSGTGGAVAANYGAVGLGSETDGSVTSPSSNCCLVGIKPTVGLVSRSGVVPISHTQDTVGPMTRTVTDAAILLGVIAGPDAGDPVTKNALARGHRDYTTFLDAAGLKGARIGIPRKGFFGYNPHSDKIAEDAIAIMKRLGAVIVDPVELPDGDELGKAENEVLLYEFKADLNAYLAGLGPSAPVKSLKDAIDFNERNRAREMPYFGQEIFIEAQAKGPLTEQGYLDALATCKRLSRTEGIDVAMDKHRLDALVAPTSEPPSLIDLVNGDYGFGSATTFPAVAGYPHITVPGGLVFGLPVGVSFFGRAWSEPVLLKLAYAFEQATKHRRPPAFLPTAEL
jgi:amidase